MKKRPNLLHDNVILPAPAYISSIGIYAVSSKRHKFARQQRVVCRSVGQLGRCPVSAMSAACLTWFRAPVTGDQLVAGGQSEVEDREVGQWVWPAHLGQQGVSTVQFCFAVCGK